MDRYGIQWHKEAYEDAEMWMDKDDAGEYVKYSDAMKLEAENAELKEEHRSAEVLLMDVNDMLRKEIAVLKKKMYILASKNGCNSAKADAIQEMYEALMEAYPLEIQSKHSHFITNWIDKLKDK